MTIWQPGHGASAHSERMQVAHLAGSGGSSLQHPAANAVADLRRDERQILTIRRPRHDWQPRQEALAVDQRAFATAVRVRDHNPVREWLKSYSTDKSELAAIGREGGR